MSQFRRGEPQFLNYLLSEVRSIMQTALTGVIEPSELRWAEKRWDAADVTATWDLGDSHRNLHGWLGGDWPVYSVRFEGAAWQDDEHRLQRRVIFVSGPISGLSVEEGGKQQPHIRFDSRETVTAELKDLIKRLQAVQLRDAPWVYSLHPHPNIDTRLQ